VSTSVIVRAVAHPGQSRVARRRTAACAGAGRMPTGRAPRWRDGRTPWTAAVNPSRAPDRRARLIGGVVGLLTLGPMGSIPTSLRPLHWAWRQAQGSWCRGGGAGGNGRPVRRRPRPTGRFAAGHL